MTKSVYFFSLIASLLLDAASAQQKASVPTQSASVPGAIPAIDPNKPIAITGGKLLTITHGTIEDGVLVIDKGKIAAVGPAAGGKSPGKRPVRRRQRHDRVSRPD